MIESVEVLSQCPLLDGQAFGDVGAYRMVTARARGTLDPSAKALEVIVNLDKAPRNARGLIEYDTTVCVLRPEEPARGNGRMLYEANNRGRKQVFRFFCDAPTAGGRLAQATDIGNGFVLRHGYTVVWSGWDATAPVADAGLTMSAPIAMENGRPQVRTIRDEFAAGTTHGAPDANPLPPDCLRLSYPVADTDPARAQLSTRRWPGDAVSVLPAAAWEYAGDRVIRLTGGPPVPGLLYDFRYPATHAPVIGIGFAATRDVVSHLRHTDTAASLLGRRMTRVIAIGVSQAGRYLRDHLALGFNRDEAGRRVFDGVLVHVAGGGRVFANDAFATPFRTRYPHSDHDYPEEMFPFSAARMTDPVTGRTAGILQADDCDPKLMDSNTSSEYWKKGASLLHTDPLGSRDVALPEDARAYLIAGTSHDGRPFMDGKPGPCRYPTNPHDPTPVLRALLVALDNWVVNGTAPPASRIPTLQNGTLCEAAALDFPSIPGITPPRAANDADPPASWVDPQPPTRIYRPLVCQTDADGNEVAGIRTPDTVVPLGTHTGWNYFGAPAAHAIGGDVVADKHGAFIPFERSKAERESRRDARPSLAERYGDRLSYVGRVAEAAQALVAERLLLPEDAARYVDRARNRLLFPG